MTDKSKHHKAGRPKGSKTRPQLRDFYTDEELKEFINDLKKRAKEDAGLAKFIAEQIFGKAVQPIGNDDGQPLIIKFDDSFTRSSEENS